MENQKHYLSSSLKPEINSLTEIVRLSRELPTVRNSDPNEVNKAILELVLDVFAFYNESPNDIQTPLILQQTKEHFLGLTLVDISVFKKHCLAGNYELKFRLTPNVFIDWIKEFKFERMEAFENLNLKAKIEIEKQPIDTKAIEMLKKLAETVKPKPSELVYSTDTSREEQQAKELQKHLTKEFEYLWEKQGKNEFDRGRGKYVFHKQGSQMLPDYLRIRFKETYDKIHEDYKKQTELNLSDYIFESINKLCQR